MPGGVKRVNFPEGFKFENLKLLFQKAHDEYANRSLQTTAREGGFAAQPKTLPQILGYETWTGSAVNTEAKLTNRDEEQLTNEKPQVSILNCTKLSIKDLKDKVVPLKETRLSFTQIDTARPLVTEDILERVGEEDELSNVEQTDSISVSSPQYQEVKGAIPTISDPAPSVTHVETEEDLLKRRIHEAVK